MKTCPTCQLSKSAEYFSKNRSSKDGLQSECKACNSIRFSKVYREDNEKRKLQLQAIHNKRKEYNREMFWQYLLEHPCDCGTSNPLLLEVDHITPLNDAKAKRIASMVNSGVSWSTILKAIETQNCQILCVECHTVKTHRELQSWRWIRYNEKGII